MNDRHNSPGLNETSQIFFWTAIAAISGLVVAALVYQLSPALAPVIALITALAFMPVAMRPLLQMKNFVSYMQTMLQEPTTVKPDLGASWNRAIDQLHSDLSAAASQKHEGLDQQQALRGLIQKAKPNLEWIEAIAMMQSELANKLSRVSEDVRQQISAMQDQYDRQRLALEDGQSVSQQLAMTHKSVNANIHKLAESVDETAASIEEMTYSIKEVARNIEDLSLAAEQTATSMNEMDRSISEVENNVNAASQLADEVSQDAARGANAVQSTLKGIEQIRSTVSVASSVMSSLGGRINEIGNILGVIEEVAEQTNLLALNAAIIAAQAGEHGRGFAVVAEEIKDLSDKTGASTKEISALIRSIQEESTKAVAAIEAGERNVQTGVDLSNQAEEALAKILQSSEKSTQRFKSIASATAEQARGSKIVADAVERIARSVQQVAAATAEQARGSEQLMRSAETITDITHQVERASVEQGQGAERASTLVESLSETSVDASGVQDRVLRACEQIEEQNRLLLDSPVDKLSKNLKMLLQDLTVQADRQEPQKQTNEKF